MDVFSSGNIFIYCTKKDIPALPPSDLSSWLNPSITRVICSPVDNSIIFSSPTWYTSCAIPLSAYSFITSHESVQSTNAKHTHDNMNTLNEIDTPFTTSLKSIYDSYDSKIVSLRNKCSNWYDNLFSIIKHKFNVLRFCIIMSTFNYVFNRKVNN